MVEKLPVDIVKVSAVSSHAWAATPRTRYVRAVVSAERGRGIKAIAVGVGGEETGIGGRVGFSGPRAISSPSHAAVTLK